MTGCDGLLTRACCGRRRSPAQMLGVSLSAGGVNAHPETPAAESR